MAVNDNEISSFSRLGASLLNNVKLALLLSFLQPVRSNNTLQTTLTIFT
jgi:hypothetical protein